MDTIPLIYYPPLEYFIPSTYWNTAVPIVHGSPKHSNGVVKKCIASICAVISRHKTGIVDVVVIEERDVSCCDENRVWKWRLLNGVRKIRRKANIALAETVRKGYWWKEL